MTKDARIPTKDAVNNFQRVGALSEIRERHCGNVADDSVWKLRQRSWAFPDKSLEGFELTRGIRCGRYRRRLTVK